MNTENRKTIDYALEYAGRGWSIIPIGKNKKPLLQSWKKYQDERANETTLRQWFEKDFPNANIAVVTGKISGIVVVDVDEGGKTEGLPPTVISKTGGGGFHYFYKCPLDGIRNAVKFRIGIDFRGDGGYAILPPSIHDSGFQYEWLLSPDDAEISEFPDQIREDISDFKITDWAVKFNAEVTEGNRNMTTTQIAGKLLHHLPVDLWEVAGWPMIKHWNNDNNKPPLSVKEVRATWESIKRIETDRRSKTYSEKIDNENKPKLPLTVSEILAMEFKPQPFIVEKLVPENGITIFSGYPESGKSWFTLYVAHCVATGKPVLDKFQVTQGAVLLIDEEAGVSEFQRRMKMFDFGQDDKVRLFSQEGFKVDNKEHLDALIATSKLCDIKLVIFDPYSAIHSKAENSAEDMQRVMEALQKFNLAGISVIFIHHHRKEHYMDRNPQVAMGLRGSTALLARADSHVYIKKEKEGDSITVAIEQIKLRRDKKPKPFRAELSIDEDSKIAKFTYVGEIEEAVKKIEAAKEFILGDLKFFPNQTMKEIVEKLKSVNIGKTATEGALKAMRENGEIIARVLPSRGQAHFYSLPEAIEANESQLIPP